ncbi:MAG: hypothetical protein MUQ10_13365, partial [Anaerolineae bacterium]|nr:hypothetical protein [Anaerolineae bacterium]
MSLAVTLLTLIASSATLLDPAIAVQASSPSAPGATFVVNNTYDEASACPDFCSLRTAILEANSNPGPDTITLEIPTNDPGYSGGDWTLHLGAPLPVLSGSDSLAIDARTLSGGACSSHFIIDASAVQYGLELSGANKQISGLLIRNAQTHGVYIYGTAAQNNQLTCNTIVSNTVDGVRIGSGAISNTIGSSSGDFNVISANGSDGVHITFAGTSGNTVAGNLIGTDSTGTSAWGNGAYGVRISNGAVTNTIGLAGASGGNLISANAFGGGVLISGATTQNNTVQNNTIGTDAVGAAALANQDGVVISNAPNNTIGPDNLISGNTRDGIRIEEGAASGN